MRQPQLVSENVATQQKLLSGTSRIFQAAQGCQAAMGAVCSAYEAEVIDVVRENAAHLREAMNLQNQQGAAMVIFDGVFLRSALWQERIFDRRPRWDIGDWAGGKAEHERSRARK